MVGLLHFLSLYLNLHLIRNHINQTQNAITNNLLALQTLMSDNQEFMRSAHVYPNASYPWAQESIANQLLRKRLQPEDQNWVDKARREGEALDAPAEEPADAFTKSTMAIDDREGSSQGMSGEDWIDLWDFAAPAAQDIFKGVWVRETEDDDDDEDEDDQGAGQGEKGKAKTEPFESAMLGMPLEDVLRYMSSGATVGVGGPPIPMG